MSILTRWEPFGALQDERRRIQRQMDRLFAVVVADQDVKLAALYCQYLGDHGISAEPARCGLECLGMVRDLDPNVLILDRELPLGDAQGVLACLREDGRSLPVILTTWNDRPETLQEFNLPPVVLCLRKLFPLPALLDGIRVAGQPARSSRSS